MSYNSDFEIRTEPPILGISFSDHYNLISDGEGLASISAVSWYDSKEKMLAVSKDWPKVVFTVSVCTEENGIFYCYYRNGLTYTYEPDMTAPPFDEARLKEPES